MDAPLNENNKKGMAKRVILLNKIIKFCIERELRPVITIPPIHPALNRRFSNTFCNNYIYKFINSANEPKVEFYDYMMDNDFMDNNIFHNSYFLNENGAKKFTEKFIKRINSKLV